MTSRDHRRTAVRSLVALAALLVVSAGSPSGAAAADRGKPKVRALVVRHAASPILTALEKQLGARIVVRKATTVPRARQDRFELLIVDGDRLSPNRIAGHRRVEEFVSTGRWVLGLDLGKGHHRRGVEPHTRFGVLNEGTGHTSRAFLFKHATVNGAPGILMLDSERGRPHGTSRARPRSRGRLMREHSQRVATLIKRRVVKGDDELDTYLRRGLAATPGIPEEAQSAFWNYSSTASEKLKDGHWDMTNHKDEYQIHAQSNPYGGELGGDQTAHWTMSHHFQAYLDNQNRPQGNFQILTYDLSGQVSPKSESEQFFRMNQATDKFRVGFNTELFLERAWWTGLIGASIQPDSATDPKLHLQDNEPHAENTTTEYTSGQDFTVHIGASSEGVEGGADYTVRNDKQYAIPDWGVSATGNGNHVSWSFSSRGACDPRNEASPPPHQNCFDLSFSGGGQPNLPNELSRSQNTIHASAMWMTRKNGQNAVLEPGDDGRLAFQVDNGITMIDTFCSAWGGTACASHDIDRIGTGPGSQTFTFDVGDVLPIPIKSINLQPNPANGARAEKVTGTVTLERPVPFDTDLVIYSNQEQAVVGTPIAGKNVSRGVITIPKGQSQGTFIVTTNDNSLSPGQHKTATISTFYAGAPTTRSLCVVTTPGGSCVS